jgi:hypothetical protein
VVAVVARDAALGQVGLDEIVRRIPLVGRHDWV